MSGAKLTQFFLFAPGWGPREGEEEQKLVFHWPPDMDTNRQVRAVGLLEAVIR
jgi:hypothetical protein